MRNVPFILTLLIASSPFARADGPQTYSVGVAQVDITPNYPVRLSGFGSRRTQSEGVTQRIWAKAIAIDDGEPSVLITVDNLGVSAAHAAELAERLKKKANLAPDRLAVSASHTHTAPMLTGVCPTLFGVPIPADHQERIDRYTREFMDSLEKVALAALADRKPARLTWGVGKVGFATNRRTRGGPVDHDLPILVVRDLNDKLRAIYVNYACHCVTLSNNKISGDWAGYAQERIQDDHPGVIALVSIGCGADQNPNSGVTGDKADLASRQGAEIAAEVKRLLGNFLAPTSGKLHCTSKRIDLPLADLPSRELWEEKAKKTDAIGHHARVQLARLDKGEKLRTKIDYRVQTWAFGDSLAMAFLPGEVVVDYSLRLKKELDGRRLWVNAYSNDSPCYIPSERVLKEGGYEGGGAMVYYDVPTAFKPGLEVQIIKAVHEQLGERFKAGFDAKKTQGTLPKSPLQSLALLQTKKELRVELMVAEPLVQSPVAIDFGPDGKLWVCEMADYPSGKDGTFQPGGRIRVVESTRGNWRFDKSTVFLDGIPFPTGVRVWRDGVLICAAPDILFAKDTNGDGKADVVKKLYSGFGTENFQGRVNSLEYGLDGWVYGSCGLFGGNITSWNKKEPFPLGNRDFRIKPDTGEIEAATGRSQQGRVRDDWDNWFGCDNSNLCWHYPLPDHYLRRNPHFAPPPAAVSVPESQTLFPLNSQQQMFKLSGPPGQPTAACGIGVYRDNLLGEEYRGNIFVCEPVNLLVHRMKLEPRQSTFVGKRAADETNSEFLASTDPWFRPVQVRTGPDGCLWVVDMYRHVIEHPRWIPPEDLVKVDTRAGHDMGRIYRIRPVDREPRAWARLRKADASELVEAINSPNGWQRDIAARLLVWKDRTEASGGLTLTGLFTTATDPAVRVQSLCAAAELDGLSTELINAAGKDTAAPVRRQAIRWSEKFVAKGAYLPSLAGLGKDSDAQVRLQLAFSFACQRKDRASIKLTNLLLSQTDDPYLTAAALSSLTGENITDVLDDLLNNFGDGTPVRVALVQKLATIGVKLGGRKSMARAITRAVEPKDGLFHPWQFAAFAGIADAVGSDGPSLDALIDGQLMQYIPGLLEQARHIVAAPDKSESDRLAAMGVLGRLASTRDAERPILIAALTPQSSVTVQAAAIAALTRMDDEATSAALTAHWKTLSPTIKSRVLDLMLSRSKSQQHLLTAIQKNEIPLGHIDLTRRQLLLNSKDKQVRELAAKVFVDVVSPDRRKVLDDYQDAIAMTGDRTRGKAVFAKNCAACHKLDGVGHNVGPDLAVQANKTPQFLLQEIFDPNRNVDTRFIEYIALTKRGRTLNGVLSGESATSITLGGQEGKSETILRTDLDQFQSTGKSLMPEGLEKQMSKQDVADVIAYLTTATIPPKRFAGNTPVVVKPSNGTFALLATRCEIYGNDIVFEEPFRNIGYWHGRQDHVVWQIDNPKEMDCDVWLDYACDDGSAGNAFIFEGITPSIRHQVKGTHGWDRYQQVKIGTARVAAGTGRLTVRPEGVPIRGAMIDLRGMYLVPVGQKPVFAVDQAVQTTDPATAARQILDDSLPHAKRQELINAHIDHAAELIAAMTVDLRPESEYHRIPWIWRVAIAAGRHNDTEKLRRLFDVSLPKMNEPLRDWQAVVIGGGIINGVSLENSWPRERLAELFKGHDALHDRWKRILPLAVVMADDEKIPPGTRYDALRIIPLDAWDMCGPQLRKYLAKGIHLELQAGAISGLSDVDRAETAPLLIGGLGHFSTGNRKLAVDALLRTNDRTQSLLTALEKGDVQRTWLVDVQIKSLTEHKDESIRVRARKLFTTK